MSDRSFRLSDLIPEPLTFTDDMVGGDGTVYDVLTLDLLSEQDVSRMFVLQRRMTRAFTAEQHDEALQAINELIQMLVPKLSGDRVAAIPLTLKTHFLDWWRQQHQQKQQEAHDPKVTGETISPTRVQRGKRSPASSPPTDSTPPDS
jgi:hypothetical protein